jgi:hypothetical protein
MVLVASGVIVLTLLQALLLPSVVRYAHLPLDTSVAEELQFADEYSLEAAIDALDTTANELGSGEMVVARVRHELDKQRSCRRPPGPKVTPSSGTTTSTEASHSLSSVGAARRSLNCATSSASTTSCCAGCKHVSTRRRCASCVRTLWSETRHDNEGKKGDFSSTMSRSEPLGRALEGIEPGGGPQP